MKRQGAAAALIAVLGIVYGDIGTSPLYAFRECFEGAHHIDISAESIIGVLSLIFWALIFIISIKYLAFILRADNKHEGGILALMALLGEKLEGRKQLAASLLVLAIFGACLLYADALITPAISILSAVEGLKEINPSFAPWVIPVSLVILVLLFACQKHGTSKIGAFFGPVMLVWFAVLGVLGVVHIWSEPQVLQALNPWAGFRFLLKHGWMSFGVLGSLFLVVTGGEALYADMGHFNAKVIREGWFWIVLPGLVLNYFGQGALLLHDPSALDQIFFLLAPKWALTPLVILATAATIIASQAIITGTYSLTSQAVQLGYSPRLAILQTSSESIGQIYIPLVNWVLMLGCLGLVVAFKESTALGDAYGLAVSGTMMVTTVLFFFVTRMIWRWPLWLALGLTGAFLIPDITFFLSNTLKIATGGWFPLLVGAVLFGIMITWHRGRELLRRMLSDGMIGSADFIRDIRSSRPHRVSGTAVFFSSNPGTVPRSLLHNYKHNKVLHKTNVFLTVVTETVPYVQGERAEVRELGESFYQITLHYGFRENPNVPEALQPIECKQLSFAPMKTTYFLSRQTLIASSAGRSRLPFWQKPLFVFMFRNALDPAKFFKIPANRVVELGEQMTI
ncbi:MAG: potassium transporter Kup [Methylacidiphilales bacterium]|nr:potassium transporter Kup [Candidatus Methylacidiphilales bacterium]